MTRKTLPKTPSFLVEYERETDKRWIADIPNLPGVMAYGLTKTEARKKVFAIALRTLADKVEHGITPASVTKLFSNEMAHS
ncbi:MAG: type II toxin-antitoxin system HicB family antitoxin [Candidatus Zambryskibacteria bacterium]|nr:type II toxin-antitoxin system HicB family antitoxin [Candidatus Zambryskibacteria bacterium]